MAAKEMKEKVIFTWSGGKDSALAFYELQKKKSYEIKALITTVAEEYERVSMHGVRKTLLAKQAESIGVSLTIIYITKNASNEEYEAKMEDVLLNYRSRGVSSVVYGDIFLEDLKRYREEKLSKIGMNGVFPLWKRNTRKLSHGFIDLGFKAVVTCIDSNELKKEFAGREFNKQFVSELPSTVDPCGENGEFHTFVYDGPIFQKKILYKNGEVVLRNKRFYFCDLVPI